MGVGTSHYRHSQAITLAPALSFSMDILDKSIVLSLNRHWSPIGVVSVRQAITSLCSESDGSKAALALDIEMGVDENGRLVLVYANPTKWDDWLALPIRENDLYIQAAKQRVRAPTVIVSARYDKVLMKRPRLSPGTIWERDGGVCQYTGRKVTRSSGNIDHVIPRDRGGRDEWTNLVLASKDVNSAKGNRLNHEVGLKLIRQPKAPPALPVSATIKEAKHCTWTPFLLS